jgi:hypothetical protein
MINAGDRIRHLRKSHRRHKMHSVVKSSSSSSRNVLGACRVTGYFGILFLTMLLLMMEAMSWPIAHGLCQNSGQEENTHG